MNRQLYQMGGIGTMPMDFGQPLQVSQPMMNPSFGPMQPMMSNPMSNYGQTPLTMADGGIANMVDREKYGLGSKLKKFVRNIIPNEVAKVATIAAPFVAPFNPLLAGAMAGLGSFDQTGKIGSSLLRAGLTYGAGQIARGIGGAGFQEGFNPFAGFDSSASFGGLGSLFSSPMGNLPFGSFSTPTPGPMNLTPTQVNLSGIDDYGQLGYAPDTFVGNPRDIPLDPNIDTFGKGTSYTDDLMKQFPKTTAEKPGYIDLIKKAGSFDNIPLSQRFDAVKDLSSKALTDLFTKPVPGQPGKTQLDKAAIFTVISGASTYYEALQLAKKAGIPEGQFSEADYQRLKVDPEKAKYKDTLKEEAFGIRKAEGGRIGYGLGDLVRGSGMATAVPGGSVSESRGLGGMIQRLIQQNPQMFRTQMSASRRDFIDNDNNGIDDREEAAGGGLMDGVLSIKLTPAMAMGGRIDYETGGPTTPSKTLPMDLESLARRLFDTNLDNLSPSEKQYLYEFKEQNKTKKAKGGIMGSEIPLRQNEGGITELDLRAKGGYIPVGIKEKADDVPAMLSRNEFVFTADAVRGAGDGNINKGAQKMYKLMKSLEKKVKKMKKVA